MDRCGRICFDSACFFFFFPSRAVDVLHQLPSIGGSAERVGLTVAYILLLGRESGCRVAICREWCRVSKDD